MIDPRAHGMMYSPEPMPQQWAGRNPMQGQPMQIPPTKNPSMGGFGFAGMPQTGPLPALPPGDGGGPGGGGGFPGPWDPSQNSFDFGDSQIPGGEFPNPIPDPGPGGSPGPGGNGPDLPNPDPWNPIPQGPGGFDSGKGVGPLWPTPQPKAPPIYKVGMPAPQPGAQYSTGGGQYQPIANSPFFGGNK